MSLPFVDMAEWCGSDGAGGALAVERANIGQGLPIWRDQTVVRIAIEGVIERRWNASAAHALLVVFPNGATITLAGDRNTVTATIGAPSGGTPLAGDKRWDQATSMLYSFSTAWDAGLTLPGGGGGSTAGLAPLASPTFTGTPSGPTPSSSDSTNRLATMAAVQAVVSAAVTGLLDLKTSLDASGTPNYPAASKGDTYIVSVAGKVGGASGKSVDAKDMVVASADNAGGTEAAVGASWFVLEHNLVGALLSANNLSDLADAAVAWTNLGGDAKARAAAVQTGALTASAGNAPNATAVMNAIAQIAGGGASVNRVAATSAIPLDSTAGKAMPLTAGQAIQITTPTVITIAPGAVDGGVCVADYEVSSTLDLSACIASGPAPTSGNRYRVTYEYSQLEGKPYAYVVQGSALAGFAPGAPAIALGAATSTTQVLTATPAAVDASHGASATYSFYKSVDGTTFTLLATQSGTSYTATGLDMTAQVLFRATANNATGSSAPSTTVSNGQPLYLFDDHFSGASVVPLAGHTPDTRNPEGKTWLGNSAYNFIAGNGTADLTWGDNNRNYYPITSRAAYTASATFSLNVSTTNFTLTFADAGGYSGGPSAATYYYAQLDKDGVFFARYVNGAYDGTGAVYTALATPINTPTTLSATLTQTTTGGVTTTKVQLAVNGSAVGAQITLPTYPGTGMGVGGGGGAHDHTTLSRVWVTA